MYYKITTIQQHELFAQYCREEIHINFITSLINSGHTILTCELIDKIDIEISKEKQKPFIDYTSDRYNYLIVEAYVFNDPHSFLINA